MKANSTHFSMKKDLCVRSVHVENSMVQYVWKMYYREVFHSDSLILELPTRVQTQVNSSLAEQQRTNLRFNRGSLGSFKKKNHFRQYLSHAESGDVDQTTINAELRVPCTLISGFSLKDQLNSDEFGLLYKNAPTTTIESGRIIGRRKHKERRTFLISTNGDASHRLLLDNRASLCASMGRKAGSLVKIITTLKSLDKPSHIFIYSCIDLISTSDALLGEKQFYS